MIQIVKGNDAPIEWRVSLNGQPLDLTGKAVSLYVINSRGPFQLKGFKVEGNVVTCTYYGADQTRFGAHSLILRLNEGLPEMSTVAVKEAFELVEWSKDQGGENGEPIKVTPVIIEADVAVAQDGSDIDLSDYLTKEEFNEASERFALADDLTELSENVAELRHDLGECDSRVGSALDMAEKHEEQLTELSSQVGGLSERVDALGEGAEQEVFWATEGITDASKGTTYDEILAAHNAGKVVKCLYQKIIFDLRYVTNILYFAANVNNNLYYLKCPQSNRWQFSTENTEHKLETLENGNAKITIAGKTAEVATPKEWKCVYDGRMEVGQMQIESTTYADGTPLDAEELVVQVIMESSEGVTQARQGYVIINSSLNKNDGQYGAIHFEKPSLTNPAISMIRLKASPFIMVADMLDAAPIAIAQGANLVARAGRNIQIYENISYVRVYSTLAIQAMPPIIKIYAR